jgi:N-methylhydantoinase B
VRVTIEGDRITFDFTRSDNQTAGPYNIRPPLVRAVCYYALKCLIDPELASNQGLADAIETMFRPGSVVCPEAPAPVNTYMPVAVSTAEAIFDALGKAVPHARIAESSSGANGTLAYAEGRRGYPQVQYELPAGAIGARSTLDGVSASKAHVANGGLTPIEIIESEYPVELLRFELIPDSGGAGRYRGGLGYVREYRLLAEATFATRGGRQLTPPAGRDGGLPGRPAAVIVNPGTSSEHVVTPQDGNLKLRRGDVLRMEQAGGGGYGDPHTRPRELVLQDVREGYVTAQAARAEYGVVLISDGSGWRLDEAATAQLRR